VSIKKLTDARLLRQARCFKMGSLDAHADRDGRLIVRNPTSVPSSISRWRYDARMGDSKIPFSHDRA
jgi:hypothetical protein